MVELGLGLVSLGRTWGVRPAPVPSDAEAQALLEAAHEAGIRFFDTAPSYGARGESRLGTFLQGLGRERMDELTVATKCGEHWDTAADAPYADHSFDALRRSIDRSLERLPKVDLLQLHKATAAVICDAGVLRAFEYARSRGVREIGVSVTDMETAALALESGVYSAIQFFYNRRNERLAAMFDLAARAGCKLIVNRPFAMGELATDDPVENFRFILRRQFEGVVLTGTRSSEHLRANIAAFREAQNSFFS